MIGRHYPYLLRLLYLREPFLVDKVCVVEEQVYLQVRWTDRIETHKTKDSRHGQQTRGTTLTSLDNSVRIDDGLSSEPAIRIFILMSSKVPCLQMQVHDDCHQTRPTPAAGSSELTSQAHRCCSS